MLRRTRLWPALLIVLTVPGACLALINPNFTPIHLVDQSQTILTLKTPDQAGDKIEMEVLSAVKGQGPKKIVIDITGATKEHSEYAKKQFKATAGQTAALYSGKFDDQVKGYLHLGGMWLLMKETAPGAWAFQAVDDQMPATWNGGTDKLLDCVKWILESGGNAIVPVDAGTKWRDVTKVAAVKGKPTDVQAIDLAGDGKCCLFVACADGDRLFQPVKGKEWEDITAKLGLASKSKAACWLDLNGDGKLDLLSFDGKELTGWLAGADGKFTAEKAQGAAVAPECGQLCLISLGEKGEPAVVVGGVLPPVVLKLTGKNTFSAATLAASKEPPAELGKPQPVVVADFTHNGVLNIIVPCEKKGLLYLGKKDGTFEEPKVVAVNCTEGGGRAQAADFDGDGWMDVASAGAGGLRIFQNLHDEAFSELMGLSGEVSYKAQPYATWCGACDFNNDGRQDLFILYGANSPLLYFNRGFRSFGEAPKLEQGLSDMPDLEKGQDMGLFADFDHDGAQDFLLVLPGGNIWCAFNDLGGEGARCIRARLTTVPGPVGVTVYQGKRCIGAWQATAGQAPAFIGVPDTGAYTIKWRLPGKPEQEKQLKLIDVPVDVILDGK